MSLWEKASQLTGDAGEVLLIDSMSITEIKSLLAIPILVNELKCHDLFSEHSGISKICVKHIDEACHLVLEEIAHRLDKLYDEGASNFKKLI